jgi:hypothetical protein
MVEIGVSVVVHSDIAAALPNLDAFDAEEGEAVVVAHIGFESVAPISETNQGRQEGQNGSDAEAVKRGTIIHLQCAGNQSSLRRDQWKGRQFPESWGWIFGEPVVMRTVMASVKAIGADFAANLVESARSERRRKHPESALEVTWEGSHRGYES